MARAKRKFITAVPVLALGIWGLGAECEEPGVGPNIDAQEDSVTVAVGEQKHLNVLSNGFVSVDPASCNGIADTSYSEMDLYVRGVAPGRCTAKLTAEKDGEIRTLDIAVTVVASSIPDGGPPDAAPIPDATEAGPTAICAMPVAKVGTQGDRDLYMAYTDVDSGEPNQSCPIHTSTDFRGDITFQFLAGSPGYSIDGRGNYEILSASPATLQNTAATSSANALEGDIITMTFRKRLFSDEDASTPRSTWTMTFRMAPDPDPAKWKVELFSFSKQ